MAREIYPTKHLVKNMRERHVTWGEIVDIVDHPEVVTSPDMQGRQLYQKGKLSVVVARNGDVITVLLRQEQQWTNEDAKKRNSQK